jgi:hypothetical protein
MKPAAATGELDPRAGRGDVPIVVAGHTSRQVTRMV